MIILQILNITGSTLSNDYFFKIEIAVIILVMLLQLTHSVRLYANIQNLRTIFKERLSIINGYVEKIKIGKSNDLLSEIQYDNDNSESLNEITGDDIIKLSLVQTTGVNEVIDRIKNTLNSYLVNNYGAAVNFSIIKDIIDREVDVTDEEISQSIPTPLYLGLAATMIGIIFGLLSMPEIGGNIPTTGNLGNELIKNTGNEFAEGINSLIRGVKWAMIASLSGLLSTTVLSSYFYKKAKRIVLRDKNDQLSYLQATLLPELVRAEDTGFSGLKASLDRFAREATKISDNVKIAAHQTGINLKAQLEVITKVENLNMIKISKTNLEIFDRLESNMKAFDQFSNYLGSINKISENLVHFSNKTENIEMIATEIKTTLNKTQEISNFLQIHSRSLTTHIEQIQGAGGSALKAVNLADSHFREAIEKLKEETNNRIAQLNSDADNNESKLTRIYNDIGKKLELIAKEHIDEFKTVYSNAVPQFNQLDNLEILPKMQQQVNENATTSQNNLDTRSDKLIETIKELNSSVKSLQTSLNGQAILLKLGTIDEKLKKDNTPNVPVNRSRPKPIDPAPLTEPPGNPETLNLIQVFKKIFSTKSK